MDYGKHRFEWTAWPTTVRYEAIDQLAYPDGVDPGQILDDLTDGQG